MLYNIPNFEGLYTITRSGKIWAFPKRTGCNNKGMWLKQYNKDGYLRTALSKHGVVKHLFIHRLLALTFIPNLNKYPVVNHMDGNTLNNNLSNLEWCTHSHNSKHAYSIGLCKNSAGENNPAAKLSLTQVQQIKNKYIPRYISSRKLAKEYGVGKSTILRIINGSNWKGGE